MIINGKKAASLNSADTRPEFIINGLLGPGVTIVASEDTYLRYILQEQMAISIATGQKFLGAFDVLESPVLFIQHGRADREAMEARLTRNSELPSLLEIESEFPRIGQGAERRIDNSFQSAKEIKVLFLGDYTMAKGGFDNWYNNFLKSQEKVEKPKELLTIQYLTRQKTAEEIRSLRKLATERRISIVLGHDLTTQGKLRERDALRYHDTEIHLRFIKSLGIYRLEVMPGSPYVQTNSWDLILDEENSRFLPAWRLEDEVPGNQTGGLPLLDNERTILSALRKGELMSLGELVKVTGIKRATVHQRLQALQTAKKGARVVSLQGNGKTQYLLNPNKEMDW
jgi:biotin operon repressor